MTIRDAGQFLAMLGLSIAFWSYGYVIQRGQAGPSVLVQPPRWVSRVCGNPRRDGRLDLQMALVQVTGFLLVTVSCGTLVLGVPFPERAKLFFAAFVICMVVGSLMTILIEYWKGRSSP